MLALEESRGILHRMLEDFAKRHPGDAGAANPAPPSGRTMEAVLARFEAEAKSPLRNLVTGDLSNLMMIQMQASAGPYPSLPFRFCCSSPFLVADSPPVVQGIKVEMESALLQMDRILQANQINFAAMASMPFFATLWGLVALVKQLLFSGSAGSSAAAMAKRREQKQYARILLVEAERAILAGGQDSGLHPREVGQQIFCLNTLYTEARGNSAEMTGPEWHNLRADILELAAPMTPISQKLLIITRMRASYSFFRDV